MPNQLLQWTDPQNGFATEIRVKQTDSPGGVPNTTLATVAMGVEQYTVSEANAPPGRRFAVQGVNTSGGTDVLGPLSNVVQVPAVGATGPTFVSAYLWPSGLALHVTFSGPLLPTGPGGAGSFHVFVDGVEKTGKSGLVEGGADQEIYKMTFTAENPPIPAGAVVTVSYDGGYLTDLDGNTAPAFATQPVTNDSTAV